MKSSFSKGISLLEILIVISILGVIVFIVVPSLSNFRSQQTINNTTDDIVSLLNQARNQTLSSQNSTYYSVHFTSTSATLFTGGTYSNGNAGNYVVNFDNLTTAGTISLNGGGTDVIFTRLTGDTTQYGTIVVQLVASPTTQKTITIRKTGVIGVN